MSRRLQLIIKLWAGLSVGLALSRLLYETDPLTFSWLGSPVGAVVLSLVFIGLTTFLLRNTDITDASWLVPTVLCWLYILTSQFSVNPLRGRLLLTGSIVLLVWFLVRFREVPQWAGTIAVGVVLLTTYLLTLQRTVGRADTFEFQVTAPVLGIAHPTGYPLYTLFGGLFSLLPVGQVATRVNLTSVISATVAGMLLFLMLHRVLAIRFSIALPASIWIALMPVLWGQAVVAEVYAFNAMFACAILLTTLWIAQRNPFTLVSQKPMLKPVEARAVVILFALCGLSMTNHLTTVFLLPSAVLALVFAWPRLSMRVWLTAIAGGAAALMLYLYIPIRWPALHNGALMPFSDFIGWITGSRFGGALQLQAWLTDPTRWEIIGRLVLEQVGMVGITAGIVGFGLMLWQRWRLAVVLLGAFLGYGFYGLNYLVPDIAVFIIPMYLIVGIWAAYGVGQLIEFSEQWTPLTAVRMLEVSASSLVVYLMLFQMWAVGPTFDWSDEVALEEWGRYVLSQPLDPKGAILADSEKIAPLEYLHRIEGQQPDMAMVVLGVESEYIANLFARLEAKQTVYLARLLPGLEGAFHLRSVGPLIEVGTEPLPLTHLSNDQLAIWDNGLELASIETARDQQAGKIGHVTLVWQLQQTIEQNSFVHLRLIDSNGAVVWRNQAQFPVSNRYPLVAWKPPETVSDYYAVEIPYTLTGGTYQLEAALAPPFTTDYLNNNTSAEWVPVTSWRIAPAENAPHSLTERVAISGTEGVFTRSDVPVRVAANTLQNGFVIGSEANGGSIQTLMPNNMSVNTVAYQLEGERLRCGWLLPLTNVCELGRAQVVQPVPEAVANYNNQILLTGVEFAAGQIFPGQTVDVTLTWQAVQPIAEDYTVFVHLLGPDGRLHGQVDSWPVQGTFPTSTWPIGEPISDRYSVMLNPDAPTGAYRLEVGLYLLATNTRLPIINGTGDPISDKLSLPGLLIPK